MSVTPRNSAELSPGDDVVTFTQVAVGVDINVQSRYGSGVRVMRLGEDDRVVTVARTERSEDADVAKPEDDGEELSPEELAALEAEDASADENGEADDTDDSENGNADANPNGDPDRE